MRVHTVVLSTQHSPDIKLEVLRSELKAKVIDAVIPAHLLTDKTIYHINPCGLFTMGGPMGDAGLTGRKIIVDTYGGWGAHGGGAFSGKDPSKVDRSAAYAARWIAKCLVKANLCRRCVVQVRNKELHNFVLTMRNAMLHTYVDFICYRCCGATVSDDIFLRNIGSG